MTSNGLTALELVRRVALASSRPELRALWYATRFNPVLARVVRLRDGELRAMGVYKQSPCLRYYTGSPLPKGTTLCDRPSLTRKRPAKPRNPPFSTPNPQTASENSAERQKTKVLELIFKFSGAHNEEARQRVLEKISTMAATELVSMR